MNWMLIDLSLQTGLRVAELAALRVGDVDFKAGVLTVRAGKGSGRDRRKRAATVPLGDNGLKRHVREYLDYFDLKAKDSFFGVTPAPSRRRSSDAPRRLGSTLATRSTVFATRSGQSITRRTRT